MKVLRKPEHQPRRPQLTPRALTDHRTESRQLDDARGLSAVTRVAAAALALGLESKYRLRDRLLRSKLRRQSGSCEGTRGRGGAQRAGRVFDASALD